MNALMKETGIEASEQELLAASGASLNMSAMANEYNGEVKNN